MGIGSFETRHLAKIFPIFIDQVDIRVALAFLPIVRGDGKQNVFSIRRPMHIAEMLHAIERVDTEGAFSSIFGVGGVAVIDERPTIRRVGDGWFDSAFGSFGVDAFWRRGNGDRRIRRRGGFLFCGWVMARQRDEK